MDKIKEYIDRYKKKLGLDEYKINILIADDSCYFSDRNEKTENKKVDYDAEVTVKLIPSKEYTIVIHKCAIQKDLGKTILHELLHILLWETVGWSDMLVTLSSLDNETMVEIQKCRDDDEETVIEKLTELLL